MGITIRRVSFDYHSFYLPFKAVWHTDHDYFNKMSPYRYEPVLGLARSLCGQLVRVDVSYRETQWTFS